MIRTCSAVGVAVLVATSGAVAASPAPAAGQRPSAVDIRSAEARSDWLVRQRPALQRSGFLPDPLLRALQARDARTSAAEEKPESKPFGFSSVALTPDLDGRGGGDVLDVRTVFTGRKTTNAVHARDGATGRVLWSRTTTAQDTFTFARGLSAGGGRARVVLLAFGGFGEDAVLTVTALDGRTGKQQWQQVRRGTYGFDEETGAFTATAAPSYDGLLAGSGGVHDVMVSTIDSRDGDDGRSGTVRPGAFRGSDGKARSLGPAVSSGVGTPLAFAFADSSGDGRDDVVVVSPGGSDKVVDDPRTPVAPSLVQVRSGVDGKVAWSRTDLTLGPNAFAHAVGSVTGSRVGGRVVADVAVSSGARSQRLTRVRGAAGMPASADSTLTLLKGNDGATSWTTHGDTVVPAGGGTVVAGTLRDVHGVTGVDTTLVVTGRDAQGAQVWQQSRTARTSEKGAFLFTFGNPIGVVGDLQPDGRSEVYYYHAGLTPEGDIEVLDGVLDGRTGAAMPVRPEHALGPAGSLTGKGDDVVSVTGGKGLVLTALRGATSTKLWTRTVAYSGKVSYSFAYTGTRRGRCSDVVVQAGDRDKGTAVVVVTANDGRLRWSIAHALTDVRATKASGPGRSFTAPCG